MLRRPGETSYKKTAFGIIPRSKLIPLEIEGIKRAWDFILRKRRNGKIAITPHMMKEIHRIGFGWIFPEMSGRFRTVDVIVSQHTPPKFYLLESCVVDFCKDLAERLRHLPLVGQPDFLETLIDILTWAHHRFLWIHPFRDYNGRIGRLLINMILLNLEFPPIELNIETKEGRRRYVCALQAADGGVYKLLSSIIRSAIEESVREGKKIV